MKDGMMVDAKGMTLYTFDRDVAGSGKSVCNGDCAVKWPPMMAADAMTIPAREDEDGVAREPVAGPVFSCHPVSGRLHMRYTARTRSIAWTDAPTTRAAVAWLQALLASDEPAKIRARLEPGMGLLCANVLHDRARFEDDPAAPRLLYRVRYFDEINRVPLHETGSRQACLVP